MKNEEYFNTDRGINSYQNYDHFDQYEDDEEALANKTNKGNNFEFSRAKGQLKKESNVSNLTKDELIHKVISAALLDPKSGQNKASADGLLHYIKKSGVSDITKGDIIKHAKAMSGIKVTGGNLVVDVKENVNEAKLTANTMIKLFKDPQWGDVKNHVYTKGSNLVYFDSYYYGGERALGQLVDSWKPGGHNFNWWKQHHNADIQIVGTFTEPFATGRHKKLTKDGIVGVELKIVAGEDKPITENTMNKSINELTLKSSTEDLAKFWYRSYDEPMGYAMGQQVKQAAKELKKRGVNLSKLIKNKGVLESVNEGIPLLKQSNLSSAEYQKAKKLKGFNTKDWVWDGKTQLYKKTSKKENMNEANDKSDADWIYKTYFKKGNKNNFDGTAKGLSSAIASDFDSNVNPKYLKNILKKYYNIDLKEGKTMNNESVNEATKRSVGKIVDALAKITVEMKKHASLYTTSKQKNDTVEMKKHIEHLKTLTGQKKILEKELDKSIGSLDKDVELVANEHIVRSQIRNIIKENLNINELHSASSNPQFNKLVKLLQACIKQAEVCGKDAKKNPSNWEGSEGVDLSVFLEEIYAGFMTGNHRDLSLSDELFK